MSEFVDKKSLVIAIHLHIAQPIKNLIFCKTLDVQIRYLESLPVPINRFFCAGGFIKELLYTVLGGTLNLKFFHCLWDNLETKINKNYLFIHTKFITVR